MKQLIGILFLACLTGTVVRAQPDHWKSNLEDATVSPVEKVEFADSLVMHYRRLHPDSAIIYAHVLLKYAQMNRDTSSADYANVHLGSLHRIVGNYDSSVYYYQVALNSYKIQGFEEGIASIYNNLATVYKTQGRYDLAIRNYHDALEIFRRTDNYNACANLYSSFAGLYLRLENYEKAYEYWNIAADYFEKDQNTLELTHVFRGLARIKIHDEDYDTAQGYVQKALEIDSANRTFVLLIEDLLLFMELNNLRGDADEFEKYKLRAADLVFEIGNPQNCAAYLEQCGDHFVKLNKEREALASYDSCLVYAPAEDVPEWRLRIERKKLRLMMSLGYKDQALLAVFDDIQRLEKEVAAIRKDRITQENAAEYELEEKEEKILLLDEKNKTAQQLIQKERELNDKSRQQLLILGLGMILFLLVLLYILRINRKLGSTKKELERNVEQKEFLFRELNHRVKNNLHIVNSFLGIEMNGRSEEVRDILKICESRIHSLGLMHEMLYQGDMNEAVELKDYLEKLTGFVTQSLVKDQTKIRTNIPSDIFLNTHKIVLVGLIVNELLTNAIKYARDPQRNLEINIHVEIQADRVSISVTDNGIGLKEDFDPQRSNTLGMKMAYGLTRQLGGTFAYRNANPGSEFLVNFEIG